jgi:hypothetical protein
MERKKKFWVLLILILVFSALSIYSAGAVDELYLTGVVMSIDLKSGTVLVDVKSHSCKGLHKFRVDNAQELEGLYGKKISFSINSSVCSASEIYKIVTITVEPEVKFQ